MPVTLKKDTRDEAIQSLQQFFEHEREERLGNLGAAALLDFFLEEIGPSVYNQAVKDVQERLQVRLMELDLEVHEEEFSYWPRRGLRR